MQRYIPLQVTLIILSLLVCCKNKNETANKVADLPGLKRGTIVTCGPEDGERFGTVSFSASVPLNLRDDFNVAIALLHSFEYDEAEKMFAKVIDQCPNCAMAYWGVAMSNFHPLWMPPSQEELVKGSKAIYIARSIQDKSKRESDYIEAIAKFYERSDQLDHVSRVLSFEKAMEQVYQNYPDDKEAAVFYTLALNAGADPRDKSYTKQRKAFSILNKLFEEEPLHPGVAHYIIHNYDYPGLAELALPAARKYASIAPASAHAQHMPSHIFTRLGLWDECARSNLVSVSAAQCYAEKANIDGHWDEELHGLDYVVYAFLQKKEDSLAKKYVDYVHTIDKVYPVNFKGAYAFAAIPARYTLERKNWREASALQLHENFPWEKFPWQEAIIHFAKLVGNIHLNRSAIAEQELGTLKALYGKLAADKNKSLEAAQVMVQIKASEALIEYNKGNRDKALELMSAAADMEDSMEKHPVTPGSVIPARELLGELLLEMNRPSLALEAFQLDLKNNPNRRNGLIGAAMAARNK